MAHPLMLLTWITHVFLGVQGFVTFGVRNEKVVPQFLLNTTECTKVSRNYSLPRIEPGHVGDVEELNIDLKRPLNRTTLALDPPLFMIPDFLTDDECQTIKRLALERGMDTAMLFGPDGSSVTTSDGDYSARVGQVTFLRADLDPRLVEIRERAARLTGMPADLMDESEEFQVGLYGKGGYYHAHYDSSETSEDEYSSKPCCHQTPHPHTSTKCLLCRYITVLVYLNDVEEGGETAFPLADIDVDTFDITEDTYNLSSFCGATGVTVKPKRGTAVMWYNNLRDEETGWIGRYDPNSLHGGCDVIKGHKWISNIWISAPQYHMRYGNSIYAERWA